MINKKVFYCSILLVLLSISIVWLLSRKTHTPSVKHVFLITIDTLRADQLGCYGFPLPTSPFIDSLAARGVRFTHTIAQSSTTNPSHTSIFTGLYPSQHGVLANDVPLATDFTTIAELFRDAGFITAAFVSTDIHFKICKIDQGFQHFDEPLYPADAPGFKYRCAEDTIHQALNWFSRQDPKRNSFTWIHLYDPHAPHRAPESFVTQIQQSATKEWFQSYATQRELTYVPFRFDMEAAYDYWTAYDAEIRYADTELGHFYQQLNASGFNKDSVWLITADHGEGLGQHTVLQHSKVIYQEELHVPLIVHYPDRPDITGVCSEMVESIDIFPTLLALGDIPLPAKKNTNSYAVSLTPLLWHPNGKHPKQMAFSEREIMPPELQKHGLSKGERYAIQNKQWKYIFWKDRDDEFYDLIHDPHERKNLVTLPGPTSNKQREMWNALQLRLRAIQKDRNALKRITDPRVREKLKSLGYL